MSTPDPRYDVAISFLHRDEPLALQVHAGACVPLLVQRTLELNVGLLPYLV